MTFGEFISERRKAQGLSQKDLAAKIKKEDGTPISPQYLNDIEHDRRRPPPAPMLDQLAEVLDVSSDEVYFYAGRLASDLRKRGYSPEKLRAAFKAFRKSLR